MIYLYAIYLSTKIHFVVKFQISAKKNQFVDRITKMVYGNYLDKTVNCNQFTYEVIYATNNLKYVFRFSPSPFIDYAMDCIKIQYLVTFLCVVVYVITADQQHSSSFLSNYARQPDICHKIGWEPTCKNSK